MSSARDRSLQEIEGDDWGDPPRDTTYLVGTVHRLRRKPVGGLRVEDLRILIGQQIGLPVLVPLALERLEQDPLAEGDFYAGDLLVAVVRAPAEFWQANPHLAARLRDVTGSVDCGELPVSAQREIEGFRSSAY